MDSLLLMKKFSSLDELVFIIRSIDESLASKVIDEDTKVSLLNRKQELISVFESRVFKENDYARMNYLLEHNPFFNPNYKTKESLCDMLKCLIEINKYLEKATTENEISYLNTRKYYILAILVEKGYAPNIYGEVNTKKDKKVLTLDKVKA